jgi:hypothetical protein
MSKILGILCLVFLLLFFSCGRETGQQKASVEIRDGIEYVHNGAEPLHSDADVRFEEDLSISSEDEEGRIILYLPYSYAVDEAGSIYIYDSQDPAIKVFNPDGRFIGMIGRKGQGPGEFQSVSRIACTPDKRLLTLDWDMNRISLFTDEGSFIGSHSFQNSSFEIFFAAESFFAREETTVQPGTAPWTWKRALSVKAFDYEGQELFSYGEFQARQSGFVNEEGRRFSFSRPFEVLSVLAGDPRNARLYHCLSDKYLIEVYNREGQIFRKIERPYKRLPVKDVDKQGYLDGFRRRGSSEKDIRLIEKNAEMPDLKPVATRMLVDGSGRLWVELTERGEAGGRTFWTYDIFDEDGYYVYRIRCDLRPGQIKGGKMYRMEQDEETGNRIFKRYRIIWTD